MKGSQMDYLKKQAEERAKAWEQAKELLDRAASENRDLTAEENETYGRITADIDERAAVIARITADMEREARAAEAMKGVESQVRDIEVPESGDSDMLRKLVRGEVRSYTIEKRDIAKSSTGTPLDVTLFDQILLRAREVGPMLDPNIVTVLNTERGEKIQIPNLSTYSVGTLTAEAAVFAESDPTFTTMVDLEAFKFGTLFQVSRELLTDSGIALEPFFAEQVGNALGFVVNTALTTGSGSSQPNGVVTASGSGITGGTGVTGAFTADNVIELVYSLDGAARRLPGFAIMGNGTAIAALRKLKDTAGNYVFQPALVGGQPDSVLGYPLHENPHMASPALSAKSLIAGHFKSYYVRQVGGIRLDRSDDFAFTNDLVTFRATIRVDGDLPQTTHIKNFIGNAA
jgi:HK97 family phage major capsid protein